MSKDFLEPKIGPWATPKPSRVKIFLRSYWKWIVLSIAFIVAFSRGDYYRKKLWPKKVDYSEYSLSKTDPTVVYDYDDNDTIYLTTTGMVSDAIQITASVGGIDLCAGDVGGTDDYIIIEVKE